MGDRTPAAIMSSHAVTFILLNRAALDKFAPWVCLRRMLGCRKNQDNQVVLLNELFVHVTPHRTLDV